MVNYFDSILPEARKEILFLESKEFGERSYIFYSEVVGDCLQWIPDLGKFKKRQIHFPHSITSHPQMETLFCMVLGTSR